MNFDGYSRGNPGESRGRLCILNHEGQVVEMLAQKSSIGTNNYVESMVLFLGIDLALKLRLENIHIEGDSILVINSCLKKKIVNSKFGYILGKAWSIIDSFKMVSFSHTLREGNQVVDNLSNIGCDL